MAANKALAFLFCDKAAKGSGEKVNLYGIFDRIATRQVPAVHALFFVFYKVTVDQPCRIELRVSDPRNSKISGPWSDEIKQPGLVQSVWCLKAMDFEQPGTYRFELWRDSRELLATTDLVVDQTGR